jgi:hypothetical protein
LEPGGAGSTISSKEEIVSHNDFDAALREFASPPERQVNLSAPFASLFPVDGASVSTLGTFLGTGTVSASDTRAARIDEVQFDLGEGPCWDAMRTARPVLAADIGEGADRWPAFIEAVRSQGITSIFAFPLYLGPLRIGAIDLYSQTPTNFDAAASEQATRLAEHVSRRVLRMAVTAVRDGEDLHPSPFSRRIIHQATGMVVSQLDISAEDAVLVIKGHAFSEGLSMMEIARRLIDRDLTFSSPDSTEGAQ